MESKRKRLQPTSSVSTAGRDDVRLDHAVHRSASEPRLDPVGGRFGGLREPAGARLRPVLDIKDDIIETALRIMNNECRRLAG